MPDSFSLDAPAKINLWLRVLGRRDDGFHELETRLAPLALCDRLTLTPDAGRRAGEIGFSCDDATVPCDESNLVVKAVRALAGATEPLPGMRLHLKKRIPHGAGLGGGSSDAAAALRLVRAAFREDLTDDALAEAAAAVGSDVPFFLSGWVADATGRGETVVPVPQFGATPQVLLVKLPFAIPTPWAYQQWKNSTEVPGLPFAPQQTPWGELRNDLERPVFEKYQVLGHLKAALLAAPGVAAALMSGSGSTVFAVLEEGAALAPVEAAVYEEVGREVRLIATRLAPGALPIQRSERTAELPATDVALGG
jgi:4-diphosphocytidyl-2-C-methyl-D-erythritol kinase